MILRFIFHPTICRSVLYRLGHGISQWTDLLHFPWPIQQGWQKGQKFFGSPIQGLCSALPQRREYYSLCERFSYAKWNCTGRLWQSLVRRQSGRLARRLSHLLYQKRRILWAPLKPGMGCTVPALWYAPVLSTQIIGRIV